MSERPILFSAPMVRAIFDGRKTQTRRTNGLDLMNDNPGAWSLMALDPDAVAHFISPDGFQMNDALRRCPYGKPGDLLWVKETFRPTADHSLEYKAGGKWEVPVELDAHPQYDLDAEWTVLHDKGEQWRPSIFMPRWASRITLKVEEVRVQRLQDISEADAIAEGCTVARTDNKFSVPGPVYRYRELWDSLNAKNHPWSSDPWVWAVTFSVAEGPKE